MTFALGVERAHEHDLSFRVRAVFLVEGQEAVRPGERRESKLSRPLERSDPRTTGFTIHSYQQDLAHSYPVGDRLGEHRGEGSSAGPDPAVSRGEKRLDEVHESGKGGDRRTRHPQNRWATMQYDVRPHPAGTTLGFTWPGDVVRSG